MLSTQYKKSRGYITWLQSQTKNKAQWFAACGHVSTSSQSLRFILSLRMNSSFITSRPALWYNNIVTLVLGVKFLIWLHTTVFSSIVQQIIYEPNPFVSDNSYWNSNIGGPRGGDRGYGPPGKSQVAIWFLRNTGMDPLRSRPRGYKTWAHSQTQNKAQLLHFILSLSLHSSFITSRPGVTLGSNYFYSPLWNMLMAKNFSETPWWNFLDPRLSNIPFPP